MQTCPPEVLELIIGHLSPSRRPRRNLDEHTSPDSLLNPDITSFESSIASLSATCRVIAAMTRPLLFERVVLSHPTRAQSLLRVLSSSSHLATSIKELMIDAPAQPATRDLLRWFAESKGASALMSRLAHVTTLIILGLGEKYDHSSGSNLPETRLIKAWKSVHCLRNITGLVLHDCVIPSDQALVELLTDVYPDIIYLHINETHLLGPSMKYVDMKAVVEQSYPGNISLPRLSHILYHNFGWGCCMSDIFSSLQCVNLTELNINPSGLQHDIRRATFEYVQGLLDSAPSLTRLVLQCAGGSPEAWDTPLNLASNGRLRDIAFLHIPLDSSHSTSWMINALLSLPSNPASMQTLEISTNLRYAPDEMWEHLDHCLSDPRFVSGLGDRKLRIQAQERMPDLVFRVSETISHKRAFPRIQQLGWFEITWPDQVEL